MDERSALLKAVGLNEMPLPDYSWQQQAFRRSELSLAGQSETVEAIDPEERMLVTSVMS